MRVKLGQFKKTAARAAMFLALSAGLLIRTDVPSLIEKAPPAEHRPAPAPVAGAESPMLVCSDLLAEDANDLALREYSEAVVGEPVECSFFGCGGIF